MTNQANPKSCRDFVEEARRVHDAYQGLCDLALGDGGAPTGDDCFAGLHRGHFLALMETLNDRLDTCLSSALDAAAQPEGLGGKVHQMIADGARPLKGNNSRSTE